MPGFLKTNMDIKLLVLFALSKFHQPASFEELLQVTMVDDGVNYFLLKQSVDELLIPENITVEQDCYTITKRGLQNLETCLTDIPLSIRQKCTDAMIEVNKAQDKRRFVRSECSLKADGTAMVHLTLLNDTGVLFEMQMMIPTLAEAEKICESFQKDSITYLYALRDVALGLTLPPGEVWKKKEE